MPEGRSSAEIWHDLSGPPRGPLTSVIRTLTRPTRPPKRPRKNAAVARCRTAKPRSGLCSKCECLRPFSSSVIPHHLCTTVEHLELVENMVLTVRTDLLIGLSMEAANVHRRFRFGKVLAERAHMRQIGRAHV